MEHVIEYRERAAALRAEAAAMTLRNAQEIKIAAAEKWEALAAEIEMVVGPNDEAMVELWIN